MPPLHLLTLPILYLSRYINGHRADYYRLLQQVTAQQNWEEWLLYILEGIEATATATTNKIATIRALETHTREHIQQRLPKLYSHELVELIFTQPYCRIGNLVDSGIAKRQAASKYLKELASIDVLVETQVGREKLFIHPRLLELFQQEANVFRHYE